MSLKHNETKLDAERRSTPGKRVRRSGKPKIEYKKRKKQRKFNKMNKRRSIGKEKNKK